MKQTDDAVSQQQQRDNEINSQWHHDVEQSDVVHQNMTSQIHSQLGRRSFGQFNNKVEVYF